MKLHNLEKLQRQRAVVAGRYIIGIDPAKAKHEAQILDPGGLPVGSSFSFAATSEGFRRQLWRQLRRRLPAAVSELADDRLADHLVFAVEASCNLWPTLVHHLERQRFRVVIVSPLATCHARPAKSGNFSRTDSKDAFLIADLARQGTFQERIMYSSDQEALHRLGITYDKLRKSLQRHYARLRAQLEILFPEFLQVLHLDTLTARHLLRRHLLPEEYLALDIDREADTLMEVSRRQHGRETLLQLQALARQSIGVLQSEPEREAQRRTADAWLALIDALETQIRCITNELIGISRRTPYHAPLTSLKGISDLLAALFLAELRDPSRFPLPKQIERLAGYNLHVSDSGTYRGRRRVSHLGNSRLRWILYQMASETSKYVPEVRTKYLRRRLRGHVNRKQNLVASIPQLLALLVALMREGRLYAEDATRIDELRQLEEELRRSKTRRRRSRRMTSSYA